MSLRDVDRERAMLSDAARGHQAFLDQALARLEAGEELYGDSWAWIGIKRHLRELLDEASDVGSWSVLADQALDREADLSELHRAQIRAVLVVAARRGAQAHEALSRALRSLERTPVG